MTRPGPVLLLTRPRPQSERFAAQCRDMLGPVETVISPILTIVPRKQAVDLSEFSGMVLTSENGARALAQMADVAGVMAWCVGDRTAGVARELGMNAVSAQGDAGALVAMLKAAQPEGRLIFAHGGFTRGDVAGRLREAGISFDERVIYDQVTTELTGAAGSLLAGDCPVVLPLFSPRSAMLVGEAVGSARAPLALVALSSAVGDAWAGPKPAHFTVAVHPDATNMLQSIATICTDLLA